MSHGYYHPDCKECRVKYRKNYYNKNKERAKIVNKKYQIKNRKIIAQKSKIYNKKHIPEHVISVRKWRKNNPEKYKD